MSKHFAKRLVFGALLIAVIGGGVWLDAARADAGGRPICAPLLACAFLLAGVRELTALLHGGGCAVPRRTLLAGCALLLLGKTAVGFFGVARAEAWGELLLAVAAMAAILASLLKRDLESGGRRAGGVSLVLLFAWLGSGWIDVVYELGEGLLFALVLGAKAGDMGAYLAGKTMGRRKLIPHVSPGKTLEGALGGIVASLAMSAWLIEHFAPGTYGIAVRLAVGALLFLAGHLGDLFESLWKRAAKVKDSGRMLPEFGGALDLIDSLFLAVPAGAAVLRIGAS